MLSFCLQHTYHHLYIFVNDSHNFHGRINHVCFNCTTILEMVYCGRLLDDKKTLLSQGLSNGATIYIFKRKMQKTESPSKFVCNH